MIVRFADDFAMGFEHRHEAEQFLTELRERFAKFGLELHPEKTRLIEVGRDALQNRRRRGEANPATFNFLGFTHISGKTRWKRSPESAAFGSRWARCFLEKGAVGRAAVRAVWSCNNEANKLSPQSSGLTSWTCPRFG